MAKARQQQTQPIQTVPIPKQRPVLLDDDVAEVLTMLAGPNGDVSNVIRGMLGPIRKALAKVQQS